MVRRVVKYVSENHYPKIVNDARLDGRKSGSDFFVPKGSAVPKLWSHFAGPKCGPQDIFIHYGTQMCPNKQTTFFWTLKLFMHTISTPKFIKLILKSEFNPTGVGNLAMGGLYI